MRLFGRFCPIYFELYGENESHFFFHVCQIEEL